MEQQSPSSEKRVDVQRSRCPFCHAAVEVGESVEVCQACHALQHSDCFEEHSGCAACGHQRAEQPREAARPELAADGESACFCGARTYRESGELCRRHLVRWTGIAAALAVVFTALGAKFGLALLVFFGVFFVIMGLGGFIEIVGWFGHHRD